MSDKANDFFRAYKAGKMSRRELMHGAGKLGLTAATANVMLNAAGTAAIAAAFDWMKYKGTKLHLLLNKHPYADAMIADLDNFKKMTGMEVTYDIFPEDVYFDKVTAALSSKSSQYDAFMTGAYMTWTYGPAGWIDDLNEFIKDPKKTNPQYNWEDVQPGTAFLDGLERCARRRARLGGRQAMVHSVGIRTQLGHLQQEDVREG